MRYKAYIFRSFSHDRSYVQMFCFIPAVTFFTLTLRRDAQGLFFGKCASRILHFLNMLRCKKVIRKLVLQKMILVTSLKQCFILSII